MVATTVLGVVVVLLAYLGRYKNTRWGLKASFGLVFLFLALRYDFGNDYGAYRRMFIEIQNSPRLSAFSNPMQFEVGWLYLNWWFGYLGFFTLVAVAALFTTFVYYRFVREYTPPRIYWLAVALYVFSPQLLLIQASAMRQTIAIALFVYSIEYIEQRKPIHYIVSVALASLFHVTAIVLLPMYLFGGRRWKPRMAFPAVCIGLFAGLMLFGQVMSPVVMDVVTRYLPKYVVYQRLGSASTGLGFVYLFMVMVLFLYLEPTADRRHAMLLRLGAVWCVLAPLTFILSLLARVGMYLAPATLVAYGVVFLKLRQPAQGIFLTAVCAFTIYSFIQFFSSDMGSIGYTHYRTILSVLPAR